MNHIFRILFAVGLTGAAVLLILALTGHFGPEFQTDHFIARTIQAALGQDVEIEEYVEASMPRNYQREMNKVPFDGFHSYSTTQWPVQKPYTTAWGEVMTYTASYFAWDTRPLPYPPEELWCVRLKSADPTVPKLVVIAFHKDIYTASWVPHEPNDVDAVLAAVGCRFSNQ